MKVFFRNLKKTYLQSSLSCGKIKSSLGLQFFLDSFSVREHLHSVFLAVEAAIANLSRLNAFIAWLERVSRQHPVPPSCWAASIRYWKVIVRSEGECVTLARSLVYSLLRRRMWWPIFDPETRTIGNNLKGYWKKGQIQDILHSSVARKFSGENFTEVLRR